MFPLKPLSEVDAAFLFLPFAPQLHDKLKGALQGKEGRWVAIFMLKVAQMITSRLTVEEMIPCLEAEPLLQQEFQQEMLRFMAFREMIHHTGQNRQEEGREGGGEKTLRASPPWNHRGDIMVIAAALGLIACLCSLSYFHHQLPGEAVGIISTIAGIFGSCLKDAYSFEFGSSRGSKDKDIPIALGLTHFSKR
jgi:hypothetical protein